MGSDEEQFAGIINTFLSTDNDVRSQAETAYEGISPDKKVFFLLGLIRNTEAPEELRQLCAVLLRRLLTAHFDFAWNALNPEAQKQVKDEVIALVSRENESLLMRKKLCEVAAELARNLIDDDGNNLWPDFLNFLFQLANSPIVPLKVNSLIIFSLVTGIFGNQQNKYIDVIKQMLAHAFQSDQYTVRYHGAKALALFVTDHEKEEAVLKHFSDLVPLYMKTMEESVHLQEEDDLLKQAIEIVGVSPKFVRPHLAPCLQLCLAIAKEEHLTTWRHLALECAVTAAETIPGGVKKACGPLIPVYIQLLLNMMTEVDEDDLEEWAHSDEAFEADNDSDASVAESCLDRFACALGGKVILPIVMEQVQPFLGDAFWGKRYAGLMAISAVGEGCTKQMEQFLPQIVPPVLGFLKDPDPRVRYAACNALGQMATDFAPNYEKKFHSKILPGLIQLLEDHSCARVQAHAGAALVNFCEECPRDILVNYADPLLGTLEKCFQIKLKELAENNKKLVLEQLVTTVASIANTLEDDFSKFYDLFMPCMKYIMQNANHKDLRLLRGKTIECASLIGLAVGADKFTADASDIMDLLLRTQVDNGGVDLDEDDPQLSYMITAWARICQILGERFAPYLPMVMGPVLRTASIKPEMAMLDPDEVKEVEGVDDWQLISLGDQQTVGLHTARLEDKAMACQMLVCYARVMKTHFRPYVDEVVKLVIPLMKFYFHDGIRTYIAEIIPHLISCLEDSKEQQVALWNMIWPDLLIATQAEPEAGVKSEQLFAIASVIEILPKEAITEDMIKKITEVVEKAFLAHFERSDERAEQKKDEDYDEVIEQQLWDEMEEDNYVLTKASDVIHSLLKIHGANYLPCMEPKIIPYVMKLVAPDRYWQERQWGICIWDDMVEFSGPAAIKYQNMFGPHLLNYLADSSPEVRQACAYGCGVMAQYGQDVFAPMCKEALPRLVQMISDPEARGENNLTATENAISAVARMIKYCPSSLNLEETIPLWLSWLPIWEDKDEMNTVYGLLCDLLESNNPVALGPQGANIPRIVNIIAEAFARNAIPNDAECRPRLINLIRMIQNDANLFQACVAQLSPECQQSLQAVLQA